MKRSSIFKLNESFVRNALERHKIWDIGNEALYDLCRRHPNHDSTESIIAKVWLIGRSYAAAIERRRDTKGISSDEFYVKVVGPSIRRSKVDAWLKEARTSASPNALIAVPVHAKLTALLSRISGIQKRSLASKYLHFHVPEVFYLLDTRAAHSIRRLTRAPRTRTNSIEPYDTQYRPFYARCEELRDGLEQLVGQPLTPRDVDTILLAVASKR